jgi:hypothetical protein
MDTVTKQKTVSANFRCAVFSHLDFLILSGTHRLSQNIGTKLPCYVVYYLRRLEISHDLMMKAMVWFCHGLRRRRRRRGGGRGGAGGGERKEEKEHSEVWFFPLSSQ